jgi:hypothetical protein
LKFLKVGAAFTKKILSSHGGKMRKALILSSLLVAGGAHAKATEAEAAKLCKELTCVGAEAKGNADGSIPAYSGKAFKYYTPEMFTLKPDRLNTMTKAEAEKMNKELYNLKPLYTVTKANVAQYASKLTEGHKELLKRYDSYKLPVYTTYRNGFFPAAVEQATKANATTATLVGTDDVQNATLGFPFPIPKSGAEILWNHKMKYLGDAARRFNNQGIVSPTGEITITKLIEDVKFKYASLSSPGKSNDGLLLYYISETLAPPKDEGQLLLVHELTGETRKAWLYNPGQRRVRLAPNVGYDNPALGTDNQQTNDQINVFNGALDRYDWKLVGKKEMIIPYNAVRINDRTLKYKDILKPKHINPELTRYELHRVWVVEATVQAGKTHQFAKRRFYLDEDSWSIAAVDLYDSRGQLYKFQEAHLFVAPFIPTVTGVPELVYDFTNGKYFATALSNEDKVADFTMTFEDKYFTSNNLASKAKR